jgi:hypothetical protein
MPIHYQERSPCRFGSSLASISEALFPEWVGDIKEWQITNQELRKDRAMMFLNQPLLLR